MQRGKGHPRSCAKTKIWLAGAFIAAWAQSSALALTPSSRSGDRIAESPYERKMKECELEWHPRREKYDAAYVACLRSGESTREECVEAREEEVKQARRSYNRCVMEARELPGG